MAKKPTVPKPVESPVLSDQEIVLEKYPDAICLPLESANQEKQKGYVIYNNDTLRFLHSGLAKSEDDAWKLAAHSVL